MSKKRVLLLLVLAGIGVAAFTSSFSSLDEKILSYTVDAKSQNIEFYWRDDSAKFFRNIFNLKNWLDTRNKTLLFAMNGGMYMENNYPLGLFIQDQKTIAQLNTRSAGGNFYLKPNGVFYITTDNKAVVCKTEDFKDDGKIKFATQSGPMLVVDGEIHPAFKEGSINVNIRNGVGILPDNKVLFAISKEEINFYDFAKYFKDKGCKNALFFDGFVSRAYFPEKEWMQMDGNFGVIIGVTAR